MENGTSSSVCVEQEENKEKNRKKKKSLSGEKGDKNSMQLI